MKQAFLALRYSPTIRRLIIISLIPLMFVIGVFAGIYLHKHRPFPYQAVATMARPMLASAIERHVPVAELAKYYAFDSRSIPLSRTVDTRLMPIRVAGVRLSELFPVGRLGGAITAIGEAVLVLDRLGNLYLRSPAGEIHKLAFPPLPNALTRFLAAGNQLDEKHFRAYDIEYLQRSRLLAVSHAAFDPVENATRMVVSVIPFDADAFKPTGEWRRLFTGDLEPNGSDMGTGGALAVDEEGNLLLTIGHYDIYHVGSEKYDGSKFGRIVKISPATGESRTVSVGHRNPQGLIVAKDGRIFSTEHGPRGGDELNIVVEGAHYGWPDVSLGITYERFDWGRGKVGRHDGYQAPLFGWLPSIGISGLIQVNGFHERWDGDLLVGSLKAQSLFRIRLDGNRVLYAESIFIGQRIRSIVQLGSGSIMLWTDDSQLLSIVPQKSDMLHPDLRRIATLGSRLRGQCMECHHFGATNPADRAPTLSGLFKRPIASDSYWYTPALRDRKGPWTEASLREFLLDPSAFASGTSMPRPFVTSEDIDEIIRLLKEASDTAH
jgi:cytochrome c2